jgi:hypothetical protein
MNPTDTSDADANVRQLTNFRKDLIKRRMEQINRIKSILANLLMLQSAPTQDYRAKEFREWIKVVPLPRVDRFEVDQLMETWEMFDNHILEIEAHIAKYSEEAKAKASHVPSKRRQT